MKMDRNIPGNNGGGKYAIVNMRRVREMCSSEIDAALHTLMEYGALDYGEIGTEGEFFLIKLKDRHSTPALDAYAASIQPTDPEFAREVLEMAERSGQHSPWCKEPD